MSNLYIIVFELAVIFSQVSGQLDQLPTEDEYVEKLSKYFEVPEIPKHEATRITGPQPEVQTTCGMIHGITTDHDNSFWGIPFAEPPVGNLRYQPPVPLDTPNDVHNKTYQDVLMCYQIGFFLNRTEDCLILDIHVPLHVDLSDSSSPPSDRLPVLFSIHGGAFMLGSGTWPTFEGSYLAEATNSVIVSVNYRLGPFGFLVHEQDEEDPILGNQGFKDQQLALQWVQDNIEMFGGDKNRVTIFGESAGGQSVMLHLLSEGSDPLFHNAILQSNPVPSYYPSFDKSANITEQVLNFIRCGPLDATPNVTRDCCRIIRSDRQCLMQATSQQLINAMIRIMAYEFVTLDIYQAVEPFRPIIDGVEFTKQPIDMFKEGNWQKHKPIILGTTSEELVLFQFLLPFLNKPLYRVLNQALFKDYGAYENTAELVSNKYIDYYGPDISNYGWLLGIQMTHIFFTCSTRALARFASNTTESSVYLYVFSHALDGPDCEQRFGPLCGYSNHAADLHFVYRTIEHMGMIPDPEDVEVMNQFSTYWGGLARTGDPNGGLETPLDGSFPTWLPYQKTSQIPWQDMRIDEPNAYIEGDYNEELCDFLDTLGLYMDPQGVPPTEPPITEPPVTTTTKQTTTSSIAAVETTSSASNMKPLMLILAITILFAEYMNQ